MQWINMAEEETLTGGAGGFNQDTRKTKPRHLAGNNRMAWAMVDITWDTSSQSRVSVFES